MCKGISVLKARLNQQLIEEYELADRLRVRQPRAVQTDLFDAAPPALEGSTAEEIHFLYTDPRPQLPVLHEGRIVVYEWGNRGDKDSRLYRTGWCQRESLEAGKWRWLEPEKVVIPANFGLEKGVWFHIEQGIEGIVVRDERQRPRVYMLTQQASHYYQTMTKHDRAPVLIEQEI
ncbi:MAG: hypothetical protein KF688_18475 [Pirellulales bacterium]|nr:hypothetical protein [Pirellulales bacterium]